MKSIRCLLKRDRTAQRATASIMEPLIRATTIHRRQMSWLSKSIFISSTIPLAKTELLYAASAVGFIKCAMINNATAETRHRSSHYVEDEA